MATYQELRTRSQQVRDEQNIGGNTALRVGQLLMDIVKYFNDNDEAASEYLQQHFAMVNDGTQLLNWQQSPIVILHTMGETYDEGDFGSLSQGENYYRAGFIMEANGQGGGINGETPKANVLYVNLANDTLYTWNGASFDAITSGGGGSISGDDILKNAYYLNGNLVLVFDTENGDKTVSIPVNFDASNYVPTSRTVNGKALSSNITLSQSDIPGLVAALAGKISGIKTSDNTPLTPDSNGIVTLPPAGSTISPATATPSMDGTASVGISDKYAREDHVHPHDSTKLSKSDVSVETQGDGTVDINVGSGANKDTYKINLNHTHENMCKLVVCEESDLPSTLDNDTIYAITDSGETEIEKLIIHGLEFAGGAPDTGLPTVVSPSDGSTLNLGENDGSGVTKTITIRAKNLSQDLTVAISGTGLSMSYGQQTGQSSITIPKNSNGAALASVDIVFSGSGGISDGSLTFTSGNDTLAAVVVVVVAELPVGYTRLEYVDNAVRGIDTGILATDSQDLTQSIAGSTWLVDVQCNSAPASNEMIVVGNEDIAHWFGAVASTGCFGSGSTEYCFSSPATTRQQIQVAFYSNKIVLTSGGETKTRNYSYQNKRNVCLLNNINASVQQYTGFQFTGRVYSIKCTSGGSFDAVPAQRISDGKKGLYDKANDVFYPLT